VISLCRNLAGEADGALPIAGIARQGDQGYSAPQSGWDRGAL
jgi:hypothetical protein